MKKEMRPGHLEDVVDTLEGVAKSLEQTVVMMERNAQAQARLTAAIFALRDSAREAAAIAKAAEERMAKIFAPRVPAVFTPEQEQRMERSIQEVEAKQKLTQN